MSKEIEKKLKRDVSFKFETSYESLFSHKSLSEKEEILRNANKIYWKTKEKLFKKSLFSKKFNWKSSFEHLTSDSEGCQNQKTKHLTKFPYRVIPLPLKKGALKNRKLNSKSLEKSGRKVYYWTFKNFKPFNLYTKESEKIPILAVKNICVSQEKKQKPVKYWGGFKKIPKYFPTTFYKKFNEQFGEFDLLQYSLEGNEDLSFLENQYFENHFSKEELQITLNKELAPYLNTLNKLLNEQPFLVLPLRATPIIYSILPEMDGIFHEFKKHKITKEMKKRVSIKDIYISGKRSLADNLLCLTPSISYLSTKLMQSLNKREWKNFERIREFDINDFSLKCYSALNPFTSWGNDKLLKESEKINKKFYWRDKLRSIFLISNSALDWEGEAPSFEKSVLMDNYEFTSFSQPAIYWAKEYHNSLRGNSILSINRS